MSNTFLEAFDKILKQVNSDDSTIMENTMGMTVF